MTLKQYIQKHGDATCANLFNVKQRTVRAWRLGERHPYHKKALEIVTLTNLKLKDIYYEL